MTRIEVLYSEGCPNAEPSLDLARRIAREAGGDVEVVEVLVTEDSVEPARFLGSPTIRVDGRDVDPAAHARTGYHYGCRLYDTPAGRVGVPPEAWVRAALPTRPGS